MSFYRYLSSLRGSTYGCQGCGFSTKSKVVYERHTKKCVFKKRWLSSRVKVDSGPSQPPLLLSDESPGSGSLHFHEIHDDDALNNENNAKTSNNVEMHSSDVPDFCKKSKGKQGKTLKKKNVVLSGNAHKRRYRNYRCKECGFLSNQSREFLNHRRYQHNERIHIHACNHCDYASKTKHKLMRHERLIHAQEYCGDLGQEVRLEKSQMTNAKDTNIELGLPSSKPKVNDKVETNFMRKNSEDIPSHEGSEILHSVLSGNIYDPSSPTIDTMTTWNIPVELPLEAVDSDCGTQEWTGNSEKCILPYTKDSGDVFDADDQEVADINANATKVGCRIKGLANLSVETPSGRKSGENSLFTFSRDSDKDVHASSINKMPTRGCKPVHATETSSSKVDRGSVMRYLKVLPGVGADPVYGCSLCRYTQPSQEKVQRHIRHIHLRTAIFKCPHCDFVCKRKTEWIVHKVSHSKKAIYACGECGYQTTFCRNYERHRRHHDIKGGSVKCKYCSYRSTGEAAVQRHMTEFHQSETKLREHAEAKALLKGQTSNLVPSVFKLSSDEEEDLSELKIPFQMSEIPVNPFVHGRSQKDRSGGSASNTTKSGIECDICGFVGKSKPHLLRHLVVHSKEAPFECSQCGLRYKRAPDLNRHIRKKHSTVNCNDLSSPQKSSGKLTAFSPTTQGSLNSLSHVEYAEGRSSVGSDTETEQNEPLNLSTKKQNESVQDSEAYDLGDTVGAAKILFKPESLKCNLCSYYAKWPSDLRRHKLIHSIEKRFKCTLCNKKFKFQGDLNKHIRGVHKIPVGKSRSRSGKYSCNTCTFTTSSAAELNRHKLLHKAKQPWACLFCSFRCLMRQDIGKHLQEDHPNEVEMYGDLEQLIDQTYSLVSGNCSLNGPTPFSGNSEEDLSIQDEEVPGKSEGKRYNCPHCSYETHSKNKIQTHMEIHGNLKRFMCPECGKRSNWIWDVRKHMRKEHPECTKDVIQMSEEEAMSTLQQYLGNTSLRCRTPKELPPKLMELKRRESSSRSECERSQNQPEQTTMRIKQDNAEYEFDDVLQSMDTSEQGWSGQGEEGADNDDSTSDFTPRPRDKLRPFKCSHCGKRSNWKWDMNKHIRIHCPGAQLIVLKMAEAKATISEVVNRRSSKFFRKARSVFQKNHNANVKKLTSEKSRPFKCSACGKRSNWKWDLNKHIRIVHPGENAQLVILNEKEDRKPSKQLVVKEESSETGKKEVLQITPGSRRPIDHHITNPISVDPLRLKRFSCSDCVYRSNFKGDIKRHIDKKHSSSREVTVVLIPREEAAETLEFYNTQCSGKRSLGNMKAKSHSLPVPLSGIDLLNMRAFTPDTNSIKTEDEPSSRPGSASSSVGGIPQKRTINTYQCKHCVFWCNSRRSMEDHCRSHSNGDLFQCKLCGDKSDYKNSMFRHLRSKHNTGDFLKNITTREVYTIVGDDADLDSTQESISMDTSAEDTPVGFLVPAYKCKVCGPLRTSVHRYSVIRHFKKRHPEMNPSDYDSFIEKYETLRPSDPNSPQPGNLTKGFEEPRPFVTPKRHRCTICPYKSSKKGLLQLHMSYHKPQPGNNLRCRHCPYYVSLSRMLHTHIRLHLEEQGLLDKPEQPVIQSNKPATPVKKPTLNVKDKTGRQTLQCEKCPYVTFSRNDFIYHKQFHRPIPNAPHKCDVCPYWAKQGRILKMHKKVHEPDYLQKRFAMYQKSGMKVAGGKQLQPMNSAEKLQQVSPCKSEISDISTDDAIEVASIKQQIIASKVKSVAVTPMKVKVSPGLVNSGSDMLSSYVVDKNSMAMGLYKKYYKCRYCPWTNVRLRNLKLHEKMHGARRGHKGKLFQCRYCDYCAGNKGLLTHHVKVHSAQYRPGQDFVNDVEEEDESLFARSGNDSTTEASDDQGADGDINREGILTKVDAEETSKRLITDGDQKMEADSFPEKSDFYLKYSDTHHKHILERAIMKRWCCEKCPYATMKKSQFEKHTQLHGSRQRYTCQYCDYSVPGYHLLLQHEKLHRLPNPNLLCIQSISNLMRLPEVPADIAAAGAYHTFDDPALDESLNKHMYENTDDYTEPKKLYRCDRCPYSNARRDHILAHLKFHMIRSEFKCPHCDYSVSKSHLLNQHIKIHFTLPGSEMSAEMPNSNGEEWEVPQLLTNQQEVVSMETDGVAKVIGKVEVQMYGDENDNMTKVMDGLEEKENQMNGGKDGSTGSALMDDGKDTLEVEDSPDTMWICQYCDRGFHSNQKLQRHEKLHLAGIVS